MFGAKFNNAQGSQVIDDSYDNFLLVGEGRLTTSSSPSNNGTLVNIPGGIPYSKCLIFVGLTPSDSHCVMAGWHEGSSFYLIGVVNGSTFTRFGIDYRIYAPSSLVPASLVPGDFGMKVISASGRVAFDSRFKQLEVADSFYSFHDRFGNLPTSSNTNNPNNLGYTPWVSVGGTGVPRYYQPDPQMPGTGWLIGMGVGARPGKLIRPDTIVRPGSGLNFYGLPFSITTLTTR